jgi:hypothetical protein
MISAELRRAPTGTCRKRASGSEAVHGLGFSALLAGTLPAFSGTLNCDYSANEPLDSSMVFSFIVLIVNISPLISPGPEHTLRQASNVATLTHPT